MARIFQEVHYGVRIGPWRWATPYLSMRDDRKGPALFDKREDADKFCAIVKEANPQATVVRVRCVEK